MIIVTMIINNSRVLYTFVQNKLFGQSLEISPTNFVFLKTFNSEFQTVEVWLTYQPLESEDGMNLILVSK